MGGDGWDYFFGVRISIGRNIVLVDGWDVVLEGYVGWYCCYEGYIFYLLLWWGLVLFSEYWVGVGIGFKGVVVLGDGGEVCFWIGVGGVDVLFVDVFFFGVWFCVGVLLVVDVKGEKGY